ncbi:hypothetical protein [Streptosporangium subroseum]|uniref:hypothetical protein n=1 Tax=Streptosporangium subroseum TaxID=106412 RepID=UPI0030937D51|nr:hypothetical protein OHB15_23790 [Streptosporangium subroseum]
MPAAARATISVRRSASRNAIALTAAWAVRCRSPKPFTTGAVATAERIAVVAAVSGL